MATVDLQMRLSEIPATREGELASEVFAKALAGHPMRKILGEDAPAHGALRADAYADGSNVLVRATLQAHVEVACGRCLERAAISLNETATCTFMPVHAWDADSDDEAEEERPEDDVDLFPYEDDVIDMTPFVQERILLAIPYTPLCNPECRGLCQQCGANLNQSPCECPAEVDPRFAALQSLKPSS